MIYSTALYIANVMWIIFEEAPLSRILLALLRNAVVARLTLGPTTFSNYPTELFFNLVDSHSLVHPGL